MAKGRTYVLVEAEGRKHLFLPLSLWPALTGIISDNEFQFHPDCWDEIIREVINMSCPTAPNLWGYSEKYAEAILEEDVEAGNHTLASVAVTPGYVHVVQSVAAWDSNNPPNRINMSITGGGVIGPFHIDTDPVAGIATIWTGEIVVAAGDLITVVFSNCSEGDDLHVRIRGYKMAIEE
jgi:hypothetical protein